MARADDTERVALRRMTQAPVQFAPGEPAPGTTPGAPAPVEYVAPFSYKSPKFKAGKQGKKAQYNYQVPQAPRFYAPPFLIPRAEAVFNDPSYQFRLNQGLDALERSAAAKGMLRTGNTLQDLMEHAQNFASQEYGNMFNRAAQAYGTNYQGLRDMYAPSYAQWQAQAQAEQDKARYGADDAWRRYELAARMHQFGIEDERLREQMLLGAGR